MPLEVLSELSAYRDLVVEVARALYLAANPGRRRLPKGFEQGLDLVVDGIGSGSAVPHVVRRAPEEGLFDGMPSAMAADDIFTHARVAIEEAIRAARTGAAFPPGFEPQVLIRFNALGRALRAKERLEIGPPGGSDPVTYDTEVRKILLRRANLAYEDAVDLVGVVRAANKDTEGFDLRLVGDGRRVPVVTQTLFLPIALSAMSTDALVRVRGVGKFSNTGELLKVQSADVGLAEEGAEGTRFGCSIPVDEQISALGTLAPGWLDGEGEAYAEADLGWTKQLVEGVLAAFSLPTPYVYPTPDGEVRLEWPLPAHEVVATLVPSTHSIDLLAVRLGEDGHMERHIDLARPGGESALGRWLVEHLSSGVS